MTFDQALEIISRNKKLIGTVTEKDLFIDLLLVVPTDEKMRKQFIHSLLFTRDPQQSIVPFIGSDVEVWATNTEYLFKQNVLFYKVICE